MYYYAIIDTTTGICMYVYEVESEIIAPDHVQIDELDTSYLFRKKYVDGVWYDTTPEEAMQYNGMHVAIFGRWLDEVLNDKSEIDHTHAGYATTDHTHSGYVSSDDLVLLEDVIDTKADSSHTHTEYASANHTHTDYALQTDVDALGEEIDEKADSTHTHADYSLISHSHNEYSLTSHNHDEDYAPLSHSHTNYATTTDLNELSTTVSGKANASHNHTGVYDESGAAASALTSANAYTDSKIDALVGDGASETLDTIGEISAAIADNQEAVDLLNAAIANKANTADLNSHANDTELHITNAERNTWNAKSNFSGSYNDLTNKPTIPSINGLATEDYVDEKVAAVTVESIGAMPNTTVIPTVPTNVSAFTNDAGYLTEHQSLDGLATETYVNTQIDAIDIPNTLSDLTADSTHRLVTDAEKAIWNAKSDFSGSYNDLTDKPSIPSISGLATETYVDEAVSTKANSSHTHSISNVSGLQSALDAKSATTHNHDTSYDTKGAASNALTSAKAYADELIEDEVTNRNSAIATAKSSAISTAASDATTKANNALTSAKTYADSAVATVKNDLLNGAGAAYDTLKELGDLIDDNADAIDALEAVASGKANATHTHAISDVANLQTILNGKAATSHGTHVSYSTTAPVMDGTASVGTASTVARSDHKHPTDTSRAAQTSLDSHTSNKSNPHGVTLAQLGVTATAAELNKMDGVTATTAELNILDGVTATTTELNYVDGVTSNIQTQLNGKASSSHTHSAATTSAAGLMSAGDKAKLDGIASGANAYTLPTASSTLGGVKTTSTVTSNSGYTACPIIGGVPYYKDTNTTYNLGSFGVTATAAELNALDGITATVTELNYMDGVKSNVQTQLDGKAASSHGTHVSYGTTAPKANGTASVGTATTVSRSDHVHPLQTTVSGNAGTATKLATARTISLTGDVTGSTSFDGSGNVSITATVADDSHNHTIANVDGLQSALDGKSATSHNHNSAYISKDLQFTGDNGGAIISYNRDDGKNILTEIAALPAGFYTVYSQSGTSGNPKTTEAWRFMVHKTGVTAGWVQGYGSVGSVYTNYIDGTNGWRGWRCIWDYDPNPLWSGQYYMSSPNSTPQTVTPSKKLSECRTGWLLLWSDYDAGSGSNDSDFVTTIIPKNDPSGNKWGGKSFLCDIPRYVGSNAEDVDTERRIIKPIYVHDDCIKGSYQNDKDERNDVVLRAVYEI